MADIDAKKVELLPCPFCGSPADIFYDSDNEANVFCTSDDCDAQIFGAKEARCIEKWNRRASLPLAGNVEGDALYLASTLRKWGHVGPRLCEKSADEIDRLLGVIRSLSSRVETEKRAKEEAETENARLARLVYVPGQWRCAKCKFTLIQANLNANGGTVTARDQPGDKCPNCDSPLWRVTERDAGNEMIDRAEEAFEAKRAAETHSAALARALEELVTKVDAFWNDPERPSVHRMRSKSVHELSDAQRRAQSLLAPKEDTNA